MNLVFQLNINTAKFTIVFRQHLSDWRSQLCV